MCKRTKIIVGLCVMSILALLLYVVLKKNKKELMENKRITLYFSPTCGHCRAFEKTWNEFKIVAKNMNVVADEINCSENSSMCQRPDVLGFPTVILENGGEKHTFTDDRTVENLIKFVKKY